MSLTRAVACNTALQVAGKAVGTVLGLLTVAIMTRHLGQDGYGEFTTVTSFLQFFGIVVDFGLTMTMVRMISEDGADEPSIASNVFTMRFVAGLLFFGIAPVVALAFPYPPLVKAGIALASLSFLSMTLSQVLVGIFQKHLSTGRAALAEVAGRAVLLGGVAYVTATGRGLLAIIIALVAANVTQFVLSFVFARKHARIRLAFDRAVWQRVFRISWPIGLAILFNLIYLKGDIIILSVTRTQAEVGLYGASYKILDVITTIPMVFMGIALPILTKAWSSGDREDFARKLLRSFDFLSMLALPLAIGAIPVAEDLMRFVAGDAFAPAGVFMAVLMIGGAAVFWSALFGHAVVALDLQRRMLPWYAADAAVSLTLYIVLVPVYGAIAAAWVTVLSEVFMAVASCTMTLGTTGIRLPMRTFLRALAASIGMVAVVALLPEVHVLLRVGLGAGVYTGLLFLFGGVTKETFAMLRREPQTP
jgi:O-antigen/teichoic acid export membrane protein